MSRIAFKTHGFAIVVCRNLQGKYLSVKESRGRGWWLPAGHVDAGQNFVDAAIRETIEEAGIEINIKGVLGVEHTLSAVDEARLRVIFYAEPKYLDLPPKSIPDEESDGAEWKSLTEIESLRMVPPPQGLRGEELLHWGRYVENGGFIAPIKIGKNKYGQTTYDGFFRLENEGPSEILIPLVLEGNGQSLCERIGTTFGGNGGIATATDGPNSLYNPVKKWTLLHAAVSENNVVSTRNLLLRGADASALTHKQRSALHFAVSRGNADIVKLLLLSTTANVNQQDYQGLTALDIARQLPTDHLQKKRIMDLLEHALI